MAETDKLKLPKITGNMTWDVVRDLNALAEAVDDVAGKPDGIAVLDAEGKLPADQLGMDTGEIASKAEINEIKGDVGDKEQLSTEVKSSVVDAVNEVEQKRETLEQEVTSHLAEDASLSKKGHVQLSNATNSTSNALAATPSAVKAAMDRADAAFTSASNGKQTVGNAIAGVDPNVVIPTDPTYQDLADAIEQISTGKRYAEGLAVSMGPNPFQNIGNTSTVNSQYIEVTGLGFEPSVIVISDNLTNATTTYRSNGVPYSKIAICTHQITTSTVTANGYKADVGNAYVSVGGFKLPVPVVLDREVTWRAYE